MNPHLVLDRNTNKIKIIVLSVLVRENSLDT